MSRTFMFTSTTAAMALLFACSQQVSDAQEEDKAAPEQDTMERAQNQGDEMPEPPAADAEMADGQESIPSMMRTSGDIMGDAGDTIGSVNLIEGPNGILMEVGIDAGSLQPGWHAIHLHQTGDCGDTGEYTDSGGHIGKIEGGHGLLNADGPEAGDLPNLHVSGDGSVNYETFTNLVSMSDILDEDGSAVIIHEGRDDHMSQPIGGAGSRVACSVLEK